MTHPDLEPKDDGFVVDTISDVSCLIDYLRDANASLGSHPEHGGTVYILTSSQDREHQLLAGVRGERGSLVWATDQVMYVPSVGINDDYVDYFTATDVDYNQPPHSEVPIETVYAVVEEFHRTRTRPESVEWVAPPTSARVSQSIDDLLFG
ncbi:Imm1 family immunity protein [Amycolatopsis sp. cg5]|uniref:Imm1 family immunity protein n=1 Tax=Amycolatopsis sp. cg5 TaxID=3238802 RepID=UPI0035262626